MKNLVVIVFLFIGSGVFAQSDELEKAALSAKFLSGEMLAEEFSKTGKEWYQVLNKFGEYPELPLDQNQKVHYSYTTDFKNISKEILYKRTLEWISINYGIFPVGLYSNPEDGKIILNTSYYLNDTYSGTFTGIITIKNEKMLVEFINVGLQAFYSGHYSGDSWIPDQTINYEIKQIYPVITKERQRWKQNLDMLKATNEQFKNDHANLCSYINSYDSDYQF